MDTTINPWLAGVLMLLAGVVLFGFTWLADKWSHTPREPNTETWRSIAGGFGLVLASFGWVGLMLLTGAMFILPLALRLWHLTGH